MPRKNIPVARSFASHLMSKYWSNENKLKPTEVYKKTSKKYKFDCPVCFHTFEAALNHIASGSGCGYCASKYLCNDDSCTFCHEKSFAAHIRSKYWCDENEISPRDVFKSSHKKYKFNCDNCDHIYEISLDNVTNRNRSCPFCSNPTQKLCLDEKCEFCHNNSFSSHPKSKYWSSENNVSPRQVAKGSTKKYKFDCPYCNQIYETNLYSISSGGRWCNCRRTKTETILYEYLQSIMNCQVIRQKQFKWCKRSRYLPFDFCIRDFKIIIELDGRQHFTQVSNWDSPEKIQENDVYKMKVANQHGYSVIRISQEDVWYNRINWKTKIYNRIKEYEEPTNILIGKIYEDHPVYQNV